jgi:uncharacterized protein YukE
MATSKELLVHGKSTIDKIKKLFKEGEDADAWKLIRDTSQPIEWVLEGQGVAGLFSYNPIGLIEELTYELFGDYQTIIMDSKTMSDGKRHFASTTIISVTVKGKALYGVATEVVDNLPMLTLATPKTVPTAFKNAMAKLGAFFGRDLNRTFEDNLPIINQESDQAKQFEAELEQIKKDLDKCKTREEAQALVDKKYSGWKLNMVVKNIIQSKPQK